MEWFIKSNDPSDAVVVNDRLKLNQCFYHFKTLYKNMEKKVWEAGGEVMSTAGESTGFSSQEAKEYKN